MYQVDERDGVEEVVMPQNRRIWMPDTYFSNGHDVVYGERHRTVVEPTGYVRSSEMLFISFSVYKNFLKKLFIYFFHFIIF